MAYVPRPVYTAMGASRHGRLCRRKNLTTKTILEVFAKQIIPGTVIVFDEYIGIEHWREDEFKAFQEAVLKHGWEYEYLCFSFVTKQVVVRIN